MHTPGPWKTQGNQIVSLGDFKPGQSWNTPVALLASNRPEHQEANARLIAAAPALLEIAEMASRADELGHVGAWLEDLARNARNAIAAARGEGAVTK